MGTKCPKCDTDNPFDSKYCKECATPLPSSKEIPVTETLETPTEELKRGTTLADRYEIIEELGMGGMGRVYKVHDTEIKEQVALKLLKPEIAADEKIIERFRNELKIARKVSHKHVCRMYDIGKEEEKYFITMEYVEGEDLKGLIKEKRKISENEVLRLAKQICEGLAEAHELGIVHRDLKPQNIMIDKEGNAKIMDFGIARSVEAPGVTQTGVIIGTPDYISPEQAEGADTDHRSDIYALGVILYEMATGSVPFKGDTALSVALKHKSQLPQDPRKLNPDVSDNLSRLILICMEKDRERRYQKAEELLADLRNIEDGFPLGTKIRPRRESIITTLIQKKILIPAVALLVITAIILVLFIPRGPSLDPNRVVVAVFENQTGDPKLNPVGRMAADWITQGLSKTDIVSVEPLPLPEVFEGIKESKDPIRSLAKKTGAGKVISGAYYLEGENIQLYAQIIDAQKGKLLRASNPVSGPVDDAVKAIKLLRQQVMGELVTLLDERISSLMGYGEWPTYKAYRECYDGLEAFSIGEFEKAIEYFSQAKELDPDFISASIWIGWSYLNLGKYAELETIYRKLDKSRDKLETINRHILDSFGAILRGDQEGKYNAWRQAAIESKGTSLNYAVANYANAINRPKEAVEMLKAEGPEMASKRRPNGVYYYWGILTRAYHMLGNHRQELKEARRGRKYYPARLEALGYELRALSALGRIKEVNKLIDESLTLPPQQWSPSQCMLIAARELRAHGYRQASIQVLERALKWFERRTKEESETRIHRDRLAQVLYEAERWEDAKDIFEALHKEFPDDINFLGWLGVFAARRGYEEEALRISSRLENIDRPYLFGRHTLWRARIVSLLGEKENAVRLLREALAQGIRYRVLHPMIDFEPLQDYPPFKELIKPKG